MDPEILSSHDLHDLLGRKIQRSRGVYVGQFRDLNYDIEDQDQYDKDPDATLIRMHQRYLAYCRRRRILLHHEEQGYWTRPYVVRGTIQYSVFSAANAQGVRSDWDRRPGRDKAMLITIAPRAVGSIWQIHQTIHDVWPRLMDFIRKTFHVRQYVWAMEPTKRHYSHYHLVTQGLQNKGQMAQAILGWLQDHGVDIGNAGVDVQVTRGDPCSYALKYIEKGVDDPLWSAMLWCSGGRIWGRSRGLGRAGGENNSDIDTGWICLGSYDIDYIEALLAGDLHPDDIGSIEWHRKGPPNT